jgi:beta-N-acetylhexosaminidase
MVHKALIAGCSGLELTGDERAFFSDARPCGLILFARNCSNREQVRALVDDARECVGDSLLALIDQEGGRVQRMGPPEWRKYPSARAFSALYLEDPDLGVRAVRAVTRLMAGDLNEVGINVDCMPVLDVPAKDGHEIIGNRAYGSDPETIVALARAAAEALIDGGVLPVIKHIPGHGRARSDSHKDLPVVEAPLAELEARDFKPFKALADMPLAMTAHVVFSALDETAPATISRLIINQVIRRRIGFGGLVISDDLEMASLTGPLPERAKSVIGAGCDVVLHCSGKLADAMAVADAVPVLDGETLARFEAALARLTDPVAFDEDAALGLLEKVAGAAV